MNEARHCEIISKLLVSREITEAVISPGARNAPLIEALASNPDIRITTIVDERTAAFVALGKADISGRAVALVCTSGTAMLNYAPALAEARMRIIPLVVITADRPHGMIGRNEPQTLEQWGALGKCVKLSLAVDSTDDDRLVNLTVNDALNIALTMPRGPVHLNVEITNPTVPASRPDTCTEVNIIEYIERDNALPKSTAIALAQMLAAPKKVMVVAGGNPPDRLLQRALGRLARFGNYIIAGDIVSNLHGREIITDIDAVLSGLTPLEAESLRPDVVITFGAPIISSCLREFLKEFTVEHWHIGFNKLSVDTFGRLTRMIESSPESFFAQIVAGTRRSEHLSQYAMEWSEAAAKSRLSARQFIKSAPWCDLTAISEMLDLTAKNCNVQLSNGMSVRYAALLPHDFHRVDCNRGVSGIEGSTSTAIGAAAAFNGTTLLVTGDTSAQYDLGALQLGCIPERFKAVVIVNGGGAIFNYINSSRNYLGTDTYLVAPQKFPIKQLATAYGFNFFEARDLSQLRDSFKKMMNDNSRPGLMAIYTDAHLSARIMTEFLKRKKYNNGTTQLGNN